MRMTSRERLLAAMRFEKVDRIPVAPFGLGALPPDSAIAGKLIRTTDPFVEAAVAGDCFWGSNCELVASEEGDMTVYIRKTPRGELRSVNRRTKITSACVDYFLKTPEHAEKFFSVDYLPPQLDSSGFHRVKQEIGEQGLVLCPIPDAVLLPAILLSPEDFCLWWADYPDLMLKLTNTAARRLNDWVVRLCRAGVDAFRIIGGEYASVQLGPKGFDALVLEQDRELVDIIHSHGAIAYYHNHGPVMVFVSRFHAIGMDFLDPLEAPPWGDADLRAARADCGDKVAFVGNLDDMEIIDKLSRKEVEAIAIERMEAAGDRGFVLGGTASGTYTERAARNFIALAELSRKISARGR